MTHNDEIGILSDKFKGLATFINRVGFPIVAFLILAYFHFVALDKNTKVLGELKDVMIAVKQNLADR